MKNTYIVEINILTEQTDYITDIANLVCPPKLLSPEPGVQLSGPFVYDAFGWLVSRPRQLAKRPSSWSTFQEPAGRSQPLDKHVSITRGNPSCAGETGSVEKGIGIGHPLCGKGVIVRTWRFAHRTANVNGLAFYNNNPHWVNPRSADPARESILLVLEY